MVNGPKSKYVLWHKNLAHIGVEKLYLLNIPGNEGP